MANNTRKKNTREQAERSFTNIDSSSASTTLRKMSLSALATVLTAATCLGGQPILASSNILLPPTTAAFAAEVRSTSDDPNPWLHTPNILEYQRYRYQNSNGDAGYVGDNEIGDWDAIKNKSMMYARVEESGGNRYLVFDVFFNNDGKSMLTSSKQQQYVWQVPFAVADLNNGAYKGDTVTDLRFDFYKRNGRSKDTPATLSHDIALFDHDEKKSFSVGVLQDGYGKENSTYTNTLGIRAGNSKSKDIYTTFHTTEAKLDPTIKKAIALPYPYSKYSYGLGLKTTNVNYAVKLHCKVKLRPNVTKDEIQNAFTWTNTSSFARNTNSSYTFISGRTHDENFPRTKSDNLPPKLYLNGKELTDDSSSIDVYQGETPTITFGTSDNSEKVTSFSVKGFPDSIKSANFDGNNKDGYDATEKNPYKHEIKDVKFEHKDGKTPVNSDYTITVSATDASGNTAEKKVTVHLKNLNQKYPSPTATPLTVDWGKTLTEGELTNQIKGNDGKGKNGKGTVTFIESPLPSTNLGDDYYKYPNANKVNVTAKITYTDGSYHLVPIPVTVKKPLALQHKSELKDHTVEVNVKDELTKTKDGSKVDAKKYLGLTDTELNNKKIKSAEWVNGEPSTAVAGKRTYTAKVTFSDDSTAEEKVTFTVRPQKPEIETDLTGVAGVKNKEVVVKAGPGTEGSTVTLKDNGKKVIGTGKVGADGKVTIKVAGGIPEGNITAVTTTADSVSSDESEPKNVSKDNAAPTLTGPDSVTVKVGEDLKIQLTAKDNVKIESIDTATATTAFSDGTDFNKILQNMSRAKTDYTTNTDKEKVFTYSFSGFKPEEVGTYNLTFSATDAAGHKTEKTVTVKVEKKENLQSKNITVDLHHKLDEGDAKKAIANSRKLPKKTKFAWAQDGKPDTSTVGKEKEGTVIVTIPTNDPKKPQVETVKVKVTVKDREKPKVVIQQKDGNSYKGIDIKTESESGGKIFTQIATITTYRGDKNDIKITATDNSGEVTTLTLTPKTPGEKEKDPTGTGTKTLMLDGTTPLNIEPRTYTRTLKAVDPSGNTNEVTVKFIVKPQADKYGDVKNNPVTYKMSEGTKHPDPKSGINADDLKKLPSDATYSWVNEPDWNKPGEQTEPEVLITFPDGSTEKVDTKVTVKDDIAPVIENPATNQVEHNDGKMYYQFKVHKGKPFDIEIKSYDNSGKISSATIPSSFPGHDGNIVIDNKDGNSANKPATIHIKGTAQRDATIANSSDNKWSRTLTVTDNAGKQSTLNIQISVYTDAEEHTATAKQVDNPKDKNAITNAITITKYDNTNKPIDKNGITFEVVGNIPTENGNYTIPVTIHYPDKSTEKVEVPVKIRKDSNDFEPEGKTIEVSWHSSTEELKKKVTSFGDNNGLKWKSTAKPDEKNKPTVTIVDDKSVPNTDNPGESKVQVKVTYSDGSSDVATVTVKVLDPQSETYTPEGQTIKVDYNKKKNTTIENSVKTDGIKLKKNGTDTTLPADATVTIDNNDTIPDGTQPGDFNIPVTITYKDGSKSHATVKVTVGKPQSETHTPKVDNSGITKKYGESSPSESEIIAKVTVPDKPDDTKITVDQGQIPIDTKTPGIVNVKVTVKYPDGSEDHVEVPVTVGNPDNVTHKASATPIELHKNEAQPTEQQIKDKVTTGVSANEDQPTITVDTGKIPTTDKTGTTNVPVTITYKDKTSTTVQVPVIVKDWNKDEYPPSAEPVEEPYNTSKDTIKNDIINAVTVDWPDKNDKTKPQPKVTITSEDKDIPSGTEPGTKTVKVTVTYPDTSTKEVTVDVTIKNKQSDTFEPTAKPVVKPYDTPVKSVDVTGNVTVPNWPKADKDKLKIELNDSNQTLPDGKTPKTVNVKVKVTYPDGTYDIVEVPVTIKNKQSELYPPTSKEITKDNGKAPTEDEIKNAVSVPNWPTGNGKLTKTVDSSNIPNGKKSGTFNVPVTVKYPDESTTVINVPVTIKAPDPIAKTGVTVPKGAEPKPEDMISNKDKFPEGTTFEWKKDAAPKTDNPGNTTGTVVVTVPDQNPVDVPVTVNVVDPTASEVNVLQGKGLPEAKAVIKDSDNTSKFPNGTDFKWKDEDKPDTNNPGTKNGVIIVTLPEQKPKEVPVTVNVLPTPVAKVVNVKVGDNLPDASNGIANKDKFPDGTQFEWEESGKPTTDTVGEKKGGKVKVTVPGVNGKTVTSSDVEVTVNVTPKPTAKETSVIQNSDPDPKNSIDNSKDLPKGTTFEWKKDAAPKTDKPGNTTGTVIVKIPGQDPQEVPVNITVTASPEGKDVTVLQNNTPDPSGLISNKDKLTGATFGWKKDNKDKETGKPDTSKTGNQPGVVTVQVPGMTPVDVPVNVLVVPNPKDKTVNVHVGDSPSAENSIANKNDLPKGTTFAWATNGKPDTSKTGDSVQGTVVVTIPGITNPVNVKVTVNVVDKDKPFINDRKAENKPGDKGSADNGKTTITGNATPEATITVQDDSGNTLKNSDGSSITTKVDDKGHFTVDVPHQNPDTKLKLVPSNNGNEGTPVDVTVIAKPKAPTITVPSENEGGKQGDGNVTVTPPTDNTVTTVEITVKPNPLNGPEQPVRTIVVKNDNGTWKIDGNNPTGATVDNNGNVTIPAKNLEDGSTITAVAKNKNNTSDTATNKTGYKTPQIKNEGQSSPQITDNNGDSGKQTITGVVTVPNATVTVTDKDGKQIGTGTAGNDGSFTITINKQKPGAIVTLTPTNGKGDGAKTGDRVELTVGGAIATPKISTPNDGSASVTPDESDTRVNKVVITYTPDNSTETSTITVVAEGDNRVWKIDGNTTPNGVTVDPQTGKVTIPAGKIKNGSTITAQAENSGDTSKNGKSEKVTDTVLRYTPHVDTAPNKPTVTTPSEGTDQGSAIVTPPADVDTLLITFLPEGSSESATPVTITVKKGANGTWTIDGTTPTGVTVDSETGKVTIPATAVKGDSEVTAQAKKGDKQSEKVTGTTASSEKKQPNKPEPKPTPIPTDKPLVVTPQDGEEQGSATVTPPAGADSMEITYIPEGEKTSSGIGETEIPSLEELTPETTNPDSQEPGNNPGSATPGNTPGNTQGNENPEGKTSGNETPARVTIKIKKDADSKWTFDGKVPEGVTVDPKTGKVTIPANKVKDNTEITAKSSKKDGKPSKTATGTVGNNPIDDLNIDDLIDNAGGNSNEKGKGHGENHGNGNNDGNGNGNDNTGDTGNNYTGDAGNKGDTLNPESGTHRIKHGDTIDANGANNNRANGDDSGSTGNGAQGTQGSQDSQGTQSGSQGAPSESQAKIDKIRARHSSGKIAKSKLSNTGAAIAAISTIAALAAAVGGAIAVIRKKKRK